MKKFNLKSIIIGAIIVLVIAAGYYYIALPAINIHSPGLWMFIILVFALIAAVFCIFNLKSSSKYRSGFSNSANIQVSYEFKTARAKRIGYILIGLTVAAIVVFAVGSLLSSEVINAAKYQKLLTVETREFVDDIDEVSYDKIPILDKDSAETIGNRVMGTMVDMVSQFEVSDVYTQINYQDKPVRVSPLEYGDIIKWLTNNKTGIKGYVKIDMTTQQAEVVRLQEGIKYSTSDHFNRNIYRHLRFNYPTYIFDEISFEIDEEGTPYWVCPVQKYNIGLFGGVTIGRVVLCNAITGETSDYPVEEAPQWIDKVYSANMLIGLYDYHGKLQHGFLNSIFGQRDCLQTTDGYNYIALDDDVWVYTGVTSVGQDESNVGFVLMNQRTMEARYYIIPGAEEYSAMSSAEGKVQHLGYKATFPLLLNVSGQPTYFMALKDSANLVKCYAMLNIEKYQTVAIGDTVSECEKNYISMLEDSGIQVKPESDNKQIKGVIEKITPVVISGNTHYYIKLEESGVLYDVSVVDNPEIIIYNVQDEIALEYKEEGKVYPASLNK